MAKAQASESGNKGNWDFFAVFLSSMGVLTLVMAVLCLLTALKVKNENKNLRRNVGYNEDVKAMIKDPKVRTLVKEHLKLSSGNKGDQRTQVKKVIRQLVQRAGQMKAFNYSTRMEDNGYMRETYTVRLSLRSLRNLVDCSYHLQLLPGIVVDTLNLARGEDRFYPWDATFTVTSFTQKKSKDESN